MTGKADLAASVTARLLNLARETGDEVWGQAWGSTSRMVTRSVTIKAILCVAFDLAAADGKPAEGCLKRWTRRPVGKEE